MEEVVSGLSKSIAEYGIMIVICSCFLGFCLIMFKKLINIIDESKKGERTANEKLTETLREKSVMLDWVEEQKKFNESILTLIKEIREGATKECTLDQVKIVFETISDQYKDIMYEELIRVKEENHLDQKSDVKNKINMVLVKHISDKKCKLYNFNWRGRPLSEFKTATDKDGILKIFVDNLYGEKEFNHDKSRRDIELFYDNMRVGFFSEVVRYNSI